MLFRSTIATSFNWQNPIRVKTGRKYGIVIKYDDPAYDIWLNKQGDRLVTETGPTNIASSGAPNSFDGDLFTVNNSGDFNSLADRDLKFKVRAAKFIANTANFVLTNKPYEFFSISSRSSETFRGGELVYQDVAAETGTVSFTSGNSTVTGTGTIFQNHTVNQYMLLDDGTNFELIKIDQVNSNTEIVLDRFPS